MQLYRIKTMVYPVQNGELKEKLKDISADQKSEWIAAVECEELG